MLWNQSISQAAQPKPSSSSEQTDRALNFPQNIGLERWVVGFCGAEMRCSELAFEQALPVLA